ncbi:MAG: S41 family peptidase [Pirellulales bacterium]
MPRANLLAILFTALVSFVCYQAQDRNPYGRYFAEIMEHVEERYVEDVNTERLFASAVNGMLGELDENSMYIGPAESDEFRQSLDQEFGGIGIHINHDPKTRELTVVATIVDTPAYRAGILAGDKIVRIDGKNVKELDDPTAHIKGKPGDAVKLTIARPDVKEPIEMAAIERAIIQVPSVLGDTRRPDGDWSFFLPGHPRIAYVRIINFGKHTREELETVMTNLEDKGFDALVLDLRNNPGGYLDAAVYASDLFLESGTIATVRGRDANLVREHYQATAPGTYSGFPMVVLINRYSASASEIVAASLQDHGRALVVGERSYGKGTVQSVIPLGDGHRDLKLTTAYYFRPSNKKIHRRPDPTQPDGHENEQAEWGVMPNEGYRIKLSDEELSNWAEWWRKRDVASKNDKAPKLDEADKQLGKALEYLEKQLDDVSAKTNAA